MDYPFFRVKNTSVKRLVVFVTKTTDGIEKEIQMWDLVNKFGAEEVLRMRRELPEIEEDGYKIMKGKKE